MSIEIGTLLIRSPDVCGGRLRTNERCITVNQLVFGISNDTLQKRLPTNIHT
jgi:hypothetical protein